MKVLSKPRHWLFGAALLLCFVLTSCGAPLAGDSWPGIYSDGKVVYVAYKDQIFRVDPSKGSGTVRHIDWLARLPNAGSHMYAPPALAADGTLYEGTYDHKVYKFSTNSGAPLNWNSPAGTEKFVGGALVNDKTVYIGNGDKGVQALDTDTGQLKASFAKTEFGVWSTPLLVEDTLYFSSLDHNVYAVDANSLQLKWKVDVGGATPDTPLFDNGMLYVGTFSNELVEIAVQDHQIKNRYTTRGWVWSTPILENGTLYFGDLSGYVYAFDPVAWALKWENHDESDRPGGIRGQLAFTHIKPQDGKERDIVIAGSESKYLRAYDASTGEVVWTAGISAEDQILSDLYVIGNDVIFTTLSERQIVGAYSVDTGRPSWHVSLPDEINLLQTPTSIPASTAVPSATAASTAAATSAQ